MRYAVTSKAKIRQKFIIKLKINTYNKSRGNSAFSITARAAFIIIIKIAV